VRELLKGDLGEPAAQGGPVDLGGGDPLPRAEGGAVIGTVLAVDDLVGRVLLADEEFVVDIGGGVGAPQGVPDGPPDLRVCGLDRLIF